MILGSQGYEKTTSDLPLVMDLLQKPKAKQMVERGAVLADGKALLDTGIFVVRGAAFSDLIEFALRDPNPVADILATGDEVSLYEEIEETHRFLPSLEGRFVVDSGVHFSATEDLQNTTFGVPMWKRRISGMRSYSQS